MNNQLVVGILALILVVVGSSFVNGSLIDNNSAGDDDYLENSIDIDSDGEQMLKALKESKKRSFERSQARGMNEDRFQNFEVVPSRFNGFIDDGHLRNFGDGRPFRNNFNPGVWQPMMPFSEPIPVNQGRTGWLGGWFHGLGRWFGIGARSGVGTRSFVGTRSGVGARSMNSLPVKNNQVELADKLAKTLKVKQGHYSDVYERIDRPHKNTRRPANNAIEDAMKKSIKQLFKKEEQQHKKHNYNNHQSKSNYHYHSKYNQADRSPGSGSKSNEINNDLYR